MILNRIQCELVLNFFKGWFCSIVANLIKTVELNNLIQLRNILNFTQIYHLVNKCNERLFSN